MISMLLCSADNRELQYILSCSRELAFMESDERWEYVTCTDERTLEEAVAGRVSYDIVCIDLTLENGLEIAGMLRRNNPGAYIMVIADRTVSPLEYVRPAIMPAGLLLRPLNGKSLKSTLTENFAACLKRFYSDCSDTSFVLDNRDGRQLVPYAQISYFESREKKIMLYTSKDQYSFYDTLDNLESSLPGDFVRCHRSFIVRKDKISKIMLSQGLLVLSGGEMIPVSRTYKATIKELR